MLAFQTRRAPLVDACVAEQKRREEAKGDADRATKDYAIECGYPPAHPDSSRVMGLLKRGRPAGIYYEILTYFRQAIPKAELDARLSASCRPLTGPPAPAGDGR